MVAVEHTVGEVQGGAKEGTKGLRLSLSAPWHCPDSHGSQQGGYMTKFALQEDHSGCITDKGMR